MKQFVNVQSNLRQRNECSTTKLVFESDPTKETQRLMRPTTETQTHAHAHTSHTRRKEIYSSANPARAAAPTAATAPPIRAGAAFAGCSGPGCAAGGVGIVIGVQVAGADEELHEPVPVGTIANVDEAATEEEDDAGGGGGGGGTEVVAGGGGGATLEVVSTAEIRLTVVVASAWLTVTTEASPAAGLSKCAEARERPAIPRRASLSCIFVCLYIYIYIYLEEIMESLVVRGI